MRCRFKIVEITYIAEMTSKVFYELLIPPTLRQLFTLESVCIEGGSVGYIHKIV